MKKKVDQFFIENFRSWSGRNYFDLNDINFLFGSNSSGKSSVIHALSLLRQSLSSDTIGDLNSINVLRPIGDFTDLGPINKQAFSLVQNKNKKISEHISFGYKFRDIDSLIKFLSRRRRILHRRSGGDEIENDFKKMDLFKGLKEIILSYTFSSSEGKLISINVLIDNKKLLEISSDSNQLKIELPKDEGFWRNNLRINKITNDEIDEELLELYQSSGIMLNRRNNELNKVIKNAKNSILDIEKKISTVIDGFEILKKTKSIIEEILKVQVIIKNKSRYRFDKHKDIFFKKIHDQIFKNNSIEDIFPFENETLNTFNSHRDEIFQSYQDNKSWFNFEKEANNTINFVKELIDQIRELKKSVGSLRNFFDIYNEDYNFDIFVDYNKTLDNVLYKLETSIILKIPNEQFNLLDSSKLNEKMIFGLYEITNLFHVIQKIIVSEEGLKLISTKLSVELNQRKIRNENYQEQLIFYKNQLSGFQKQKKESEITLSESSITFQNFIELINKKKFLTINLDENITSISFFINRLTRNLSIHRDKVSDDNNIKLINVINNNSILSGFSIFEFIRMLQSNFFNNFRKLRVIGPHRRRPNRIELINPFEINNNVGIEGQNILNILKNADKKDLNELNKRLKTLEISYSVSTKFREEDNSIKVLVKDLNGLTVSLTDVGYGVGQILPIVLECVLSKNKLLTIEQPELHLHPKLQANLTDLIIWSARNNNNKFILETHSEHMILRLKRRLRENFEKEGQGNSEVETLTNDVTINVITTNKKELKSQNKLLKITPSGNFNGDWPEGFFEERFVELGID